MSSKKKTDFSGYKHEPRVSLRADIARFLVFARDRAPGIFVAYNEVCQRINKYPKAPNLKSREVEALRSASSSVRKILMDEYRCGLVTDPALGMRATVATDGGIDAIKTQAVKAASRLRSAQDMVVRTANLINISEVPSTPENRPFKEWYKSGLLPVVKAITSTDFAAKLLPPKREE